MKNPFIRNRKEHLAHIREVFFAVAIDSEVQAALLSSSSGSKNKIRSYTFPPCTRMEDTDLDRAIRLLGYSNKDPDIYTLLFLASHSDIHLLIRLLALRELFSKDNTRRSIALQNALSRKSPVIELKAGQIVFAPEELQWKILIKKSDHSFVEMTEIKDQGEVVEIINVLSQIPVIGKFSPDIMSFQTLQDLSMNRPQGYLQIVKDLGNHNGPMLTPILSEFLEDNNWEVRESAARILIQKAKEDFSQVMHSWGKISKLITTRRSSEAEEVYHDSGSLTDCSVPTIYHTDTGIVLEIPPELRTQT